MQKDFVSKMSQTLGESEAKIRQILGKSVAKIKHLGSYNEIIIQGDRHRYLKYYDKTIKHFNKIKNL